MRTLYDDSDSVILHIILKTNHPVEALVSTDRSVVAALLSTTARPVTKSSANDLTPQHCFGMFLLWLPAAVSSS